MFTGIVEGLGTIRDIAARARGVRRVLIRADFALGRLPQGASIACDGVCLTVVARRGRQFAADLGPETLAMTTLGARRAGDRVHLERPLRVGDPLGGHLVAGHVDGVGRVVARVPRGRALALAVALPRALARLVAPKGSITIDGVSLTVNRVHGAVVEVLLIPHTLAVTTLGERRPGGRVNIETDLVAKHVDRVVRRALARQVAARTRRARLQP